MLVLKSYKYRLYPTPEQVKRLAQDVGNNRFVWNYFLNQNINELNDKKKLITGYDADKILTKIKKDYPFLKLSQSQALQQKIKDLKLSWDAFFDKKQKNSKKPKFKSKIRDISQSFRIPISGNNKFEIQNNKLKFPKYQDGIRFINSRNIPDSAKVKNITILLESGNWYISVQFQQEIELPKSPNANSMVGLDVGINKFAALSNGELFNPLNSFKKWEDKLAFEQRKLSKKQKHSSNFKKQSLKVNKVHKKIADCRKDYLQKLSTTLSKSHACIVVEDLDIKNISKSAKGTKNKPGKNVSAKSGLNKSILDQGWGMFINMLEYKQKYSGGLLIKVPPQYTSQKCSCCGHTTKENRKTQANFNCQSCGYSDNADVNAAKNIKALGHSVLACGEFS